VLDELHTYRGRQGADVALLVRRAREAFAAERLQCVGTSATLAGRGPFEAQRVEVARVASRLFGTPVQPEHVIGETLRRATPAHDLGDPDFVAALRRRLEDGGDPPRDYGGFVADPLSIWIESTFGLATEPGSGRLVRTVPRSLTGPAGAGRVLSQQTGLSEAACTRAIERQLLASYGGAPNPDISPMWT
jgi:hypothetical protein